MTLQQKVAGLIGQWHGADAAERASLLESLSAAIIKTVAAEVPQPAPKIQDPTPLCAFCGAKFMDSVFSPRRRSAA